MNTENLVAPRRGRGWTPEVSGWKAGLLALPLIILLAVFVLWPTWQLVSKSVSGPRGVRSFVDFFDSKANVRALTVTLVMCTIVTALALVLGTVIAWSLRATKSRVGRFILLTAVLVPLWMGVVVKNYAFLVILGRRGILNEALLFLHLIDEPMDLLYTPTAVVIGMLYSMLPYAVLPLYSIFLTIPLELPRAAESLGATRSRAMTSVVAPLAVPGMFATGVIVFVLSLGFYVTPVILGGPRATFLATLIQNDIFRRFDPVSAATAGTLLVVIVSVVLAAATKLIGSDRLKRAIG